MRYGGRGARRDCVELEEASGLLFVNWPQANQYSSGHRLFLFPLQFRVVLFEEFPDLVPEAEQPLPLLDVKGVTGIRCRP